MERHRVRRELVDGFADLVLGTACLGCARPGRAWCLECAAALRPRPHVAWPSPTPPGLVLPVAALDYSGAVRDLVVAHKERGRLGLAAPLGSLLATAVAGLLRVAAADDVGRGVRLVPVPSDARVVRRRRHDPMLRISRSAAAALRRDGVPAGVERLVRVARAPDDQAGLGAAARAANVADSLVARPVRPLREAGRLLVVVDDVVTTGATLREAQRALETAGWSVLGAATVAATRRRTAPDARVHLSGRPVRTSASRSSGIIS